MTTMRATVRAEVRKLRRTRSLLAVPAAGIVVAVVGNVLLLGVGEPADIGDRLSHHGPLRFGPTNFGLLLVVFGVRLFADETQHGTLAGTLIRTPDRRHVAAAKAIVGTATAVAFCTIVYALVIPSTLVGVSFLHHAMSIDAMATVMLFLRVTTAMVLLTVFGVAAGAAFHNRTVALVAVVVWFALAEDLVGALLHATRFLPSAAVQSLVAGGSATATSGAVATLVLSVLVGVTACSAAVALRRDIP